MILIISNYLFLEVYSKSKEKYFILELKHHLHELYFGGRSIAFGSNLQVEIDISLTNHCSSLSSGTALSFHPLIYRPDNSL